MIKPSTTLLIPGTGLGGAGKTMSLAVTANYLRDRGHKMALIDCDRENEGGLRSFSHWFGGKTNALDLRDRDDCDQLLRQAAASEFPYVLCDFPANSRGDISDWLDDVATPDLLSDLGLRVIALGAITPNPGAAAAVVKWMHMLGDRATYLITLCRTQFDRKVKPAEVAFSEWFDWANASGQKDILFVEIPHLRDVLKRSILKIGKLPSLAAKDSSIDTVDRKQIEKWIQRINAQLDSTGLFVPENAEALAVK